MPVVSTDTKRGLDAMLAISTVCSITKAFTVSVSSTDISWEIKRVCPVPPRKPLVAVASLEK